MKDILHRIKFYCKYLVTSKTKYYLHSPFVYEFYMHVLEPKNNTLAIENIRSSLLANHNKITFQDFGNGGIKCTRKISVIAKRSATTFKYGNVLLNTVKHFKPKTVLELGTNIGIGTCYLAQGNKNTHIVTIEGSKELSEIAQQNTYKIGIKNIDFEVGNFDDILLAILKKMENVDLVFIDGNHKKETTLRYFEQILNFSNECSIIVFDDIYWSAEMTEAWEIIKQHEKVKLSIDIYKMGFIFFKKSKLAKENFKLLF